MVEYREGGQRRIDRVLAPGFAQNLGAADHGDLLVRRDDAEQEEADLSYARRLLQGRIDLLRAEQERRSGNGDALDTHGARSDDDIVAALTKVLAEDRPTAGAPADFIDTPPSRIGEHRRAAEAAVADVRTSDPEALGDDELETALGRLTALERSVSESRRAVQKVLDALAAEVGERVAAGSITADLSRRMV